GGLVGAGAGIVEAGGVEGAGGGQAELGVGAIVGGGGDVTDDGAGVEGLLRGGEAVARRQQAAECTDFGPSGGGLEELEVAVGVEGGANCFVVVVEPYAVPRVGRGVVEGVRGVVTA